jgi:predicted AlkP superfamily pyrophosphatase or phosphodiesterase
MRSILLLLCCSAIFASAHGPGRTNDFEGRRVLMIGIDGCRADAVRKLVEAGRAPNLKSLIEAGTVTWNGYTGGNLGTPTQQDTVSGPGWSTILTGVWREQHGVADNRFRYHRLAQWPHWMRRLKESRPTAWTASLCDWAEIHRYIVGESKVQGRGFLNFEFLATLDPALGGADYDRRDAELTARAVEHLKVANPDAMFVYFGQVDGVGHGGGGGRFSPDNDAYLASIIAVDGLVGKVLEAMRARSKFAEENWLVLATTDHGGTGKSHGGQTPEERTVWMVASGGAMAKGAVLEGSISHTAFVPAAFRHLGVPILPEWGMKAAPFGPPAEAK